MEKTNTVAVKLTVPIEHDGKTIDTLNFRRMKARDALVAEDEKNQVMAGYRMFAALADVDVEVILELDMADLAEIGEVVAPLMGKRLLAAMKDLN